MADQKYIKHSIVIPTIGRIEALEALLCSLVDAKITYPYEVLIVDQNPDGFLQASITQFSSQLPIKHLLVNFKGLSKAKNYGFNQAKGQFLSFLDDDSMVFKDTFSNAFALLDEHKADIIFGKCIDEKGNDSVLNFKKEFVTLNQQNMLGGFVEATMLCKREVFDVFLFDENMGAGCFFGAEEGYDWLYRILSHHSPYKVVYSPEIKFYHPQIILSKGDYASLDRVFKYRCGTAYLCVKHGFAWKLKKRICLSALASWLYAFFDQKKAAYYRVEKSALLVGQAFAEIKLKS